MTKGCGAKLFGALRWLTMAADECVLWQARGPLGEPGLAHGQTLTFGSGCRLNLVQAPDPGRCALGEKVRSGAKSPGVGLATGASIYSGIMPTVGLAIGFANRSALRSRARERCWSASVAG